MSALRPSEDASTSGVPEQAVGERLLALEKKIDALLAAQGSTVDPKPSSSEGRNVRTHRGPSLEIEEKERGRLVRSATSMLGKLASDEVFGRRMSRQAPLPEELSAAAKESPADLLRRGLVLPQSKLRLRWDLVSIALICFVALSLPPRIAFVEGRSSTAWQVIDFLIDVRCLRTARTPPATRASTNARSLKDNDLVGIPSYCRDLDFASDSSSSSSTFSSTCVP